MPTFDDGPKIDGNDITVSQHAVAGYPVHDLIVDRYTHDAGKSRHIAFCSVIYEIRGSSVLAETVSGHRVQIGRRHTRLRCLTHAPQCTRHDQTRGAHILDLRAGLQLNSPMKHD